MTETIFCYKDLAVYGELGMWGGMVRYGWV